MDSKTYSVVIGDKTITATFSDLAEQANGSVMLSCEDTVVLATACMSRSGQGNPGFFNLTVDYLEKYYAAGLILGGQYNKREGRPSDEAILTSRIIDRTIRPLFDKHIKNAVQVIVTVLSVGRTDPGILAVNAASLALHVSDIPWGGPIGAVHIGRVKGETETKVDPYTPNTGNTGYDLDLTICGRQGNIVMIEALAYEWKEEALGDAFDRALVEIKKFEQFQEDIRKEIGKTKKDMPAPMVPEEMKELSAKEIEKPLLEGLFGEKSKATIHEMEEKWLTLIKEKYPDQEEMVSIAKDYYHHITDELVHKGALEKNARVDGRDWKKVRNLFAQAGGISPVLHGSGIFYRGETHVLSTLTLAGPEAQQILEGMEVRGSKRFMHHYNFPPYSVGETGRMGGLNRREMGHGFLVEKALTPVIPEKEQFPYTIRVVSESVASNGSTSQASICASTLALMDGGVPIKAPVAGIAMGLMLDESNHANYKILTDIQGPEDHYGDMDFKVAGTREGVTALQLDIKVDGVPAKILKEALLQAKEARLTILDTIEKTIPAPRKDISPSAPHILIIKIKTDQIGLVIGSGGKTIKEIKEKTGAEITLEDDGTVYISGKGDSAEKAKKIVESITKEWIVGETVNARVAKIAEFGAFVDLDERTTGLIHVSEIAPFRVEKVADFLKVGDMVPVKVIRVEEGKVAVSIKAADPTFIKKPSTV